MYLYTRSLTTTKVSPSGSCSFSSCDFHSLIVAIFGFREILACRLLIRSSKVEINMIYYSIIIRIVTVDVDCDVTIEKT